jgi:hypothetical protein
LQEVARTLADFRHEFRNQLASLVRNDVYRAEQTAALQRIQRLEEDGQRSETDKAASRRMTMNSFLVSGLAFVGSMVMFIISLSVHH